MLAPRRCRFLWCLSLLQWLQMPKLLSCRLKQELAAYAAQAAASNAWAGTYTMLDTCCKDVREMQAPTVMSKSESIHMAAQFLCCLFYTLKEKLVKESKLRARASSAHSPFPYAL